MVNVRYPLFTVHLKSNPTTGYRWILQEYDSRFIQPTQHEFRSSDSKLIGAPGYEHWTFRVSQEAFSRPHHLVIRFVYRRPWQKSVDPSAAQAVFNIDTTVFQR